jgi:hypothetical protein
VSGWLTAVLGKDANLMNLDFWTKIVTFITAIIVCISTALGVLRKKEKDHATSAQEVKKSERPPIPWIELLAVSPMLIMLFVLCGFAIFMLVSVVIRK